MKEQPTANHALECSASPALTSWGYPSEDHTPVVTKSAFTTMYPDPPEGGRTQSLLSDRGVNKLRLNLNLVWCLVPIIFVSTIPFKLFYAAQHYFILLSRSPLLTHTSQEQVTEANQAAPCNMYSPAYFIPSQPSTPLYPPGTTTYPQLPLWDFPSLLT